MAKLLAIDFGEKRCGLAETDDLQIIASAMETVPTVEVHKYLNRYILENKVETLVVGLPLRHSGEESEVEKHIQTFIDKFQKSHPKIGVERVNEAFTSKMAMQSMVQSGQKKKTRRQKGNLDKISATLILQNFMEQRRNANPW